jgi:hypothetical protein
MSVRAITMAADIAADIADIVVIATGAEAAAKRK